jgi:hypothetical protein
MFARGQARRRESCEWRDPFRGALPRLRGSHEAGRRLACTIGCPLFQSRLRDDLSSAYQRTYVDNRNSRPIMVYDLVCVAKSCCLRRPFFSRASATQNYRPTPRRAAEFLIAAATFFRLPTSSGRRLASSLRAARRLCRKTISLPFLDGMKSTSVA